MNGPSRITWQLYLGEPEDIAARWQGGRPVVVADFGVLTALWTLVVRLDLVGIIDWVVPTWDHEVSVGHDQVLAPRHRVPAPKSRTRIGPWYGKTWLKQHWTIPASTFTSQAFWRAMDAVNADVLTAIEDAVAKAIVGCFGIRVHTMAYDATKFFTDSETPTPGLLAQRHHHQQKRNDPRQVNLPRLSTVEGPPCIPPTQAMYRIPGIRMRPGVAPHAVYPTCDAPR
ncbi:MAG: hypothetical protein ACP5QO_14110 [Clostridia bacterium]